MTAEDPPRTELKLRVDHLDLSEADGGRQTSWTAGVNWHLNPNSRFMFEGFHTTLDGASNYESTVWDEDTLMGLQMRVQVGF